jgi:hypothetical protein
LLPGKSIFLWLWSHKSIFPVTIGWNTGIVSYLVCKS